MIIRGDCVAAMAAMELCSVDAIVCDPPYNLSFMAKPWDCHDGQEDAGFAYWLAGLIDGEGHFAIKGHSRGSHAPSFALKMRADEEGTVRLIERTLRFGTVTFEERAEGNRMVRWVVQDKEGCQRLVDLLDKYPLRAKKRIDYMTWREAVCEWTSRPRGNRWHGAADNTRMGALRERLMTRRGYVEPAWSGHEFQDWCRLWGYEAMRVLKPGGHLLAFGGTRTVHRLVAGLEDAGFEIRDTIAYMYGSGFPKSLDVSKAVDKVVGAEGVWRQEDHAGRPGKRTRDGSNIGQTNHATGDNPDGLRHVYDPASDEAKQWAGWGTALKPGWEPIVVARKPLAGTVAGNVLAHGTGALNIDGCRIGFSSAGDERESKAKNRHADFGSGPRENAVFGEDKRARGEHGNYDPPGRWPANVLLSHSEDCVQVGERQVRADGHFPAQRGASGYGSAVEGSSGGGLKGQDLAERTFDGEVVERWACVPGCPVRTLDDQSGESVSSGTSGQGAYSSGVTYGAGAGQARGDGVGFGDRGGASRFYYCAKASRAERNAGLDDFEKKPILWSSGEQNPGSFQAEGTDRSARNPHPTVKPIDLMRWLVRLVTPPGGTVLDPFAGSGTTGCAAALESFDFIGIERDPEYVKIAEARIAFWQSKPAGIAVERVLRAEAVSPERSGQLSIL